MESKEVLFCYISLAEWPVAGSRRVPRRRARWPGTTWAGGRTCLSRRVEEEESKIYQPWPWDEIDVGKMESATDAEERDVSSLLCPSAVARSAMSENGCENRISQSIMGKWKLIK